MTQGLRAARARLALAAALSVAIAYQVQRPLLLRATDALSSLTFRDFSGAESSFRWSGARSTVVFPDPGPGVPVRIEVALSGWRPRGQEAPLVALAHGGRSVSTRPGPGGEVVVLETRTSGLWRSDLAVEIRSETFRPGPRDARELGVRVEEARLVPTAAGLRLPPLRAIVLASGLVLFLFALLVETGVSPAAAQRAGLTTCAVLGLGYAFARPWAAFAAWPLLLAVASLTVAARLAPARARGAAEILGRAASALGIGARRLLDWRAAVLLGATLVAIAAAYRVSPRVEIDLGTGREAAVARGFGIFDAMNGATYRRAPRTATLDLGDFGGGTRWTVAATASIEGAPKTVRVLSGGGYEIVTALRDGEWTTQTMTATAPVGWRSGLVLTVPGGSDALRLERVTVDRGHALPSPRTAAVLVASVALLIVIFGAVSLPAGAGLAAGAFVAAGAACALASDPLVAIPFATLFLAIVAAGTLLAAGAAALVLGDEERSPQRLAWSTALGAGTCGFIAWWTATAFPLYRGGHFVFHSSIAEEIWKGRFLIYYLPYPGSMLSEQAHWGHIVVPHPCLYQTLAAPLAALPKPWFYVAEKAVLAFLFASLVVLASRLAARAAGTTAAMFTAAVVIALVPTFQLLGLGHLMTILGVWTSSLALGWLVHRGDRLSERATWWVAVGLLTFCFLSYFAALLFTLVVLVLLLVWLSRRDRARARSLLTVSLAAAALAFALYYVHWAWPFLSRSIPAILGGAGTEATPILHRLKLEPGKLTYSYGSLLIPLAGLAGLVALPRSWTRQVLLAWGAVLVLIGGADIFFNFILKHHYYVIVPVAVGFGALLARAWETSRAGKAVALTGVAVLLALGLQTAIDVAVGRIP